MTDRQDQLSEDTIEEHLSHEVRSRRMRPRATTIAIHLAPMIDVTFLLLIFFLVTTTFGRPEGVLTSELPKDAGRPSVPLPTTPIVVRLSQGGSDGTGYEISIDNYTQAPADFRDLADHLRHIQSQDGFDKETPVVLVSEGGVRWDHVVNAWNTAVRCEFTNIAFGGS